MNLSALWWRVASLRAAVPFLSKPKAKSAKKDSDQQPTVGRGCSERREASSPAMCAPSQSLSARLDSLSSTSRGGAATTVHLQAGRATAPRLGCRVKSTSADDQTETTDRLTSSSAPIASSPVLSVCMRCLPSFEFAPARPLRPAPFRPSLLHWPALCPPLSDGGF